MLSLPVILGKELFLRHVLLNSPKPGMSRARGVGTSLAFPGKALCPRAGLGPGEAGGALASSAKLKRARKISEIQIKNI